MTDKYCDIFDELAISMLCKGRRVDNGEWVEGSLIQTPYLGSIRSWISSEQEDKARLREISSNKAVWRAFEVRTDTICQCTGLKDKNGKLIWENDIMVAHLDDSFPEDTTYTRVVWNNNGFCTKTKGSDCIFPLDKFDQENFEVCGNLFDNPEIINE